MNGANRSERKKAGVVWKSYFPDVFGGCLKLPKEKKEQCSSPCPFPLMEKNQKIKAVCFHAYPVAIWQIPGMMLLSIRFRNKSGMTCGNKAGVLLPPDHLFGIHLCAVNLQGVSVDAVGQVFGVHANAAVAPLGDLHLFDRPAEAVIKEHAGVAAALRQVEADDGLIPEGVGAVLEKYGLPARELHLQGVVAAKP